MARGKYPADRSRPGPAGDGHAEEGRFISNDLLPLVRLAARAPHGTVKLTKQHDLVVMSHSDKGIAHILSIDAEFAWVRMLLHTLKRPSYKKLYKLRRIYGVVSYATTGPKAHLPLKYVELDRRTIRSSADAFLAEHAKPGQRCYYKVVIEVK